MIHGRFNVFRTKQMLESKKVSHNGSLFSQEGLYGRLKGKGVVINI